MNPTGLRPPPPSPSWLDDFLKAAHHRTYKRRSSLRLAGHSSEVLSYIVSGSAVVSIDREHDAGSREGRHDIVVGYRHPGDFINEAELFTSQPDLTRVTARTNMQLAEISYGIFRAFATRHPDLMGLVAGQVAGQLNQIRDRVCSMAYDSAVTRVLRALNDLADNPDAMTHPEGMQVSVTRTDLGRIIGCTRETCSRALDELEATGVLRARGKTILMIREPVPFVSQPF